MPSTVVDVLNNGVRPEPKVARARVYTVTANKPIRKTDAAGDDGPPSTNTYAAPTGSIPPTSNASVGGRTCTYPFTRRCHSNKERMVTTATKPAHHCPPAMRAAS